eukprot:1824817-Prymnesium_polylepis.1
MAYCMCSGQTGTSSPGGLGDGVASLAANWTGCAMQQPLPWGQASLNLWQLSLSPKQSTSRSQKETACSSLAAQR